MFRKKKHTVQIRYLKIWLISVVSKVNQGSVNRTIINVTHQLFVSDCSQCDINFPLQQILRKFTGHFQDRLLD